MSKLEEMPSYTLIGYYKEAVMDYNYNPTDKKYNQSGYTLEELENEVLNRINYVNEIEPETGDYE